YRRLGLGRYLRQRMRPERAGGAFQGMRGALGGGGIARRQRASYRRDRARLLLGKFSQQDFVAPQIAAGPLQPVAYVDTGNGEVDRARLGFGGPGRGNRRQALGVASGAPQPAQQHAEQLIWINWL